MKNIVKRIVKETIVSEIKKPHLMVENEDLGVIKSLKKSIEDKLKKVYEKITGKDLNLPNIDIKLDDKIIDGEIVNKKKDEL